MSVNYTTGQLIGPYQIQKYLNGGGMGDVYLAWDGARGRQVALKLLKPEAMRDPKLVERFRREAVVTSQLRHPHLVQVYNVGQTPEGRHYMAMAYVDGGTLEDRLQQYRGRNQLMPVNEALYLARRIAEAMAYAHQHGIVHRDLKPGNILLRRTGEPVVTDLGIAAIAGASSLTRTLDSLGTPHYMAPEQVRQGEVDARVDIYAIGVLLYEMLTGRRPFEAENAWAILNMKLNQMPTKVTTYRADIPAEVAQIIHTCLQTNAAARYPSAQTLAQALDAYTYGVGLPETVRTATPQPNRSQQSAAQTPAGRKTYLTPVFALLGILAVGLFIILASRPGTAPITPTSIPIAAATMTTFPTSTPLQRPPTQTPASTPTPLSRGLIIGIEAPLPVFQEWQLDDLCISSEARRTDMFVAQNGLIYLLTDFNQPRYAEAIADDGSCKPFEFIKIRTVNNDVIEGWVLKNYVQRIDNGNASAVALSLAPTPTPSSRVIQVPTLISPACDGSEHVFGMDQLVLEWKWDGAWDEGDRWLIRIGEDKDPNNDDVLSLYAGKKGREALVSGSADRWEFTTIPGVFHKGQNIVNYQWEVVLVNGSTELAASPQGCFTIANLPPSPTSRAPVATSSPAPLAGTRRISRPELISPRCNDGRHYFSPGDQVSFEWRWDGALAEGDYLELRVGSDVAGTLPGRGSVSENARVAGFTNRWLYRVPVTTFHPGGTVVDYEWEIAHLDASGQTLSFSTRGCLTVIAGIQPNPTSTPALNATSPPPTSPPPTPTSPPPPTPIPTVPPYPYP